MRRIIPLYHKIFTLIAQYSDDFLKVFMRLYVADVFFRAGYLKIQSWDSTLYLFESEYQVPFISWELAAYLGTAAELILPVLLALGLITRLTALSLFLFNILAVLSYPVIWQGGFYDHKLWGIMLLWTVIYGEGRLSIDHIICKIRSH